MQQPYKPLEENVPFSQSILWKLQRDYFEKQGISAWQEGVVPHYITSNPAVAKAYAEMVFAFFRDHARTQRGNSERIYILELGAGSGRLAYHLLKHLTLLHEHAAFEIPPYTYVLSDFTPANVQFWKDHYKLKPFEENSILDYACFDAENNTEIHLQVSGTVLRPGSLNTPLLIVANYFFDSIPNDLFLIENQSVSEVRASVFVAGDDDTVSPSLEALTHTYSHTPVDSTACYAEAGLNRLLDTYRTQLTQTYLLFPHVPIRCLERLRALSCKGFVLLTADKGHQHLQDLDYAPEPSLVKHGSFSLSVNYHAIQAFYEHQGAAALFPSQGYQSINVLCLLMLPQPEKYKETLTAYYNYVERFSPDDFFNLKKHFERHIDSMTLWQLQSYIRLSGYDARFFKQCIPHLINLLSKVSGAEARNMRLLLYHVWDMYYPIGEQQDLCFDIACAFYCMDMYEDALVFFEISLVHYGPSPTAYYNMASCYYQLERDELAKEFIDKALALDAAHEGALHLQEQLADIVRWSAI